MSQTPIEQDNPDSVLTQSGLRLGIILSAILSLIQWILFGVFSWRLPPEIPLFYSVPLGAGQLADKLWFLFLPLISLFAILLSLIFIRLSRYQPSIFSYIIVWGTTLNVFLLVVVMSHIVYLVL